jgi:4-amino-4-deoxy-L-arabinose transferase-like glycosyltransferase
MSRRPFPASEHRGLWLIAGLFLVLSNLYGLVTPVFEASDEISHYPYVHYLATEHRLPVQDPANIQEWKQEGSQPPLYYVVSALVTSWIDVGDLRERLVRNPHATIGIPLAPDNKNMVIHTTAERFPFRGTVLAVHLIRFLSTLMGTATVCLTYWIARETLPESGFVPLAAAAVTAFNPMFLFVSGSVNNDNLAVLLCTVALWLMVRLLGRGATVRRVFWLGVVVGLAALTKLSALGLVALLAVALTWDAWRRNSWKAWLRHGLLAAGVVAAIAGWWYLRNWRLYGDPLGLNVWLAIGGSRQIALAGLRSELQGFRMSYWGVFGGFTVLMHPLLYSFYDALALLALVGLLLAGGRRIASLAKLPLRSWLTGRSDPRFARLVILALWPLILLVSLVRWTLLTPASQGRLIFPGIAALSFWLALGWAGLAPVRWRRAVLGAIGVALFIPAVLAPWAFIAPAYTVPPTSAALPDTLTPLHISYGGQLELVGYHLAERALLPGQTLALELGWRALERMDEDYSVFVHLYGPQGDLLGQADTYPGGGMSPTSQWAAGDLLLDTVYVPVRPDAAGPALGRIVVGVYHFPDMAMLPASDPNGADLGTSPTVSRIKVEGTSAPEASIPQEASFQLGPNLALVGYDLTAAPAEVTLYWQATGPVPADYTVFIHVLDAAGNKVAQADGQPQAGNYPTSWWSAGEVVADRHLLPPDAVANLPPGAYTLSVGFYDPGTGERLPVSAQGVPLGDWLQLGPVVVP